MTEITFLFQPLLKPHACSRIMLPAQERSVRLMKKIAKGTHRNVNYLSKLFQPQNVVPKDGNVKSEDSLSKSQKVGLFVCFTSTVQRLL
jgi:hypothetical protein